MSSSFSDLTETVKNDIGINRNKYSWRRFRKEKAFHFMIWPGMIFLIIFCYIPMVGIVIAFKDFKPAMGIFGSKTVGLAQFNLLFSDQQFGRVILNTIGMSAVKFVPGFIAPIVFALLLNEMKMPKFKRVVQTVSYLPYFVSWVVVASILRFWLSTDSFGVINHVLVGIGLIKEPIAFLSSTDYFWTIAAISDVWKNVGWWSIIYLAAMSGVDTQLYDAAIIDGANRIQRIIHITIPSIRSTMITLLILNAGALIFGGFGGSNFSQSYLLMNPLNQEVSDILDTYVLRYGLQLGRFSYAAAAGLLQSIVSLLLVFISNYSVKLIDRDEAFF